MINENVASLTSDQLQRMPEYDWLRRVWVPLDWKRDGAETLEWVLDEHSEKRKLIDWLVRVGDDFIDKERAARKKAEQEKQKMENEQPLFTLQHLADGQCRVAYRWNPDKCTKDQRYIQLNHEDIGSKTIHCAGYGSCCVKSEKEAKAWLDRHTVVEDPGTTYKKAAAWARKWKLVVRIINRMRWV